MPTLTYQVDGQTNTVAVPMGKRLVNALEDEAKVDQMHACGGYAKCTTCRVQFLSGEPAMMTQAEKDKLKEKGLDQQKGLRLSCQALMEHDMSVQVLARLSTSGKPDAGKRCGDDIEPLPAWVPRS